MARGSGVPPAVGGHTSGRSLQGVALLLGAALLGTLLLQFGPRRPAESPPPAHVTDEPVVVHVVGEVRRPGLYRLAGGSRVADAIAAAGGPSVAADLTALNLARVVEDGEQLLVPGPAQADAGTAGARAGGRLNLNRAGPAELDTLPGIGPVLAARIVAYREQHGGFRAVRDLRRVPGIGEKLYRSLEELVTV